MQLVVIFLLLIQLKIYKFRLKSFEHFEKKEDIRTC